MDEGFHERLVQPDEKLLRQTNYLRWSDKKTLLSHRIMKTYKMDSWIHPFAETSASFLLCSQRCNDSVIKQGINCLDTMKILQNNIIPICIRLGLHVCTSRSIKFGEHYPIYHNWVMAKNTQCTSHAQRIPCGMEKTTYHRPTRFSYLFFRYFCHEKTHFERSVILAREEYSKIARVPKDNIEG